MQDRKTHTGVCTINERQNRRKMGRVILHQSWRESPAKWHQDHKVKRNGGCRRAQTCSPTPTEPQNPKHRHWSAQTRTI